MTVLTRAQLIAQITATITSNGIGAITGAILRQDLLDMIDSMAFNTGAARVVTDNSQPILIADNDALIIMSFVAPANTTIQLGTLAGRAGLLLNIIDLSSSLQVGGHSSLILPNGAESIMNQPNWTMYSSSDTTLSQAKLQPVTAANNWVFG